jgi:L-arabinokinase
VIAAYVSGHGFGHATRTSEVLRAVRALAPELKIAVVTSAPERIFREAVADPLVYRGRACDVGVAQRDALVIDEEETIARWRAFEAGRTGFVAEEADWLRRAGARAVLADIPPAAFEAARAAGLPAIGLTNFSWDWIYAHLARRVPELEEAAEGAREAYATCDRLLELPFTGDLSAFPRRERIPMVARPQRRPRAETRGRLGLDGETAVLLSFGGVGLPGLDPAVLAALPACRVLLETLRTDVPANVLAITPSWLGELGLAFLDLVGAADVVVTKPGYGVVTDCIAARTRLVYTDRGDFPEYPIMVAELPRYLAAAYVDNEGLRAGRLEGALRSVLALEMPRPPDLSGAEVAARRLLEALNG